MLEKFVMLEFLALSQLVVSLYMTGLIWIIQRVHYPSFLWIPESKARKFSKFHSQRLLPLTAPFMFVEIVGAIALIFVSSSLSTSFLYGNLLTVLILWGLTLFVSMPLHLKLQKQFNSQLCRKLVLTNWPRTFVWTARSVVWLAVFAGR